MVEITRLLGEVVAISEGIDLATFDLSEILGRYNELAARIQGEEESLRQVARLIALAGRLLEKKVAN